VHGQQNIKFAFLPLESHSTNEGLLLLNWWNKWVCSRNDADECRLIKVTKFYFNSTICLLHHQLRTTE